MAYRFLPASLPINLTPKETFTSDFQRNLDEEFKVSTDWYTIKEEYPFASGTLVDIDVRINHVINTKTGFNQGDDYKTILFKNLSHVSRIGYMYYFDNNYWIVVNSESMKSLAASVTVKRCNNVLKWMDYETGRIYTAPCSIDYMIQQNRDYSTAGSSLVIPSGTIEVITQSNPTTNRIVPSQRFLFGNPTNWQGFKIMGGGINNFNHLETEDNNTTGLIRITMSSAQKGEGEIDDLVNGIADVREYNYLLSLNHNFLSVEAGKSVLLVPNLTLNGTTYSSNFSSNFTWSTSNPLFATVDSEGLVTAIASGSCTITCSMTNNPSIYETCVLTISSTVTDVYEIVINPNVNYVLEDNENTFSVFLYKNGIEQVDTFTFSLDVGNEVPAGNFNFSTVDGNNFLIKNIKRFISSPLSIKCVSGAYEKVFDIYLKGAW